MSNEGISVADALALRNNGTSDNGWGDSNGWWIILLILFAGGWNRGFGGFGAEMMAVMVIMLVACRQLHKV